MKLARDPEMEMWIEMLQGTTKDFDWDSGNYSKNFKHEITAKEIEQLLEQVIVFAGLSPPVFEGTTFIGITGAQGPGR